MQWKPAKPEGQPILEGEATECSRGPPSTPSSSGQRAPSMIDSLCLRLPATRPTTSLQRHVAEQHDEG